MRTGSLNVRRRRRAKVAVVTASLALGAFFLSSLALPVRAANLPDPVKADITLQVTAHPSAGCCIAAPDAA